MKILKEILETKIDVNKKEIESFRENFLDYSFDSLVWSASIFQAVAENKVYLEFLNLLNYKNFKQLQEYYMQEVICGARSPSFSTSPTANLCDIYLLRAHSKLLGYINDAIRRKYDNTI